MLLPRMKSSVYSVFLVLLLSYVEAWMRSRSFRPPFNALLSRQVIGRNTISISSARQTLHGSSGRGKMQTYSTSTRSTNCGVGRSATSSRVVVLPPPLPLAETIFEEHASAREQFALRYITSLTAFRVVVVSAAVGRLVYEFTPRLLRWLYEDMKTDPMERAQYATGRFMPISAKFRSEVKADSNTSKEGSGAISSYALDALMNREIGFRTRVEMFIGRMLFEIPVVKRINKYVNRVYVNVTSRLSL